MERCILHDDKNSYKIEQLCAAELKQKGTLAMNILLSNDLVIQSSIQLNFVYLGTKKTSAIFLTRESVV